MGRCVWGGGCGEVGVGRRWVWGGGYGCGEVGVGVGVGRWVWVWGGGCGPTPTSPHPHPPPHTHTHTHLPTPTPTPTSPHPHPHPPPHTHTHLPTPTPTSPHPHPPPHTHTHLPTEVTNDEKRTGHNVADICNLHRKVYLQHYSWTQKKCCDPLGHHPTKAVTRSLRVITDKMVEVEWSVCYDSETTSYRLCWMMTQRITALFFGSTSNAVGTLSCVKYKCLLHCVQFSNATASFHHL